MSQPPQTPEGPPYLSNNAGLGGRPTKSLDVPICCVFIVLFVLGAVGNMTILQVNMHRGKKFVMSGMLFGFCMARITATSMRIAWAFHPTNIRIAIAAQILVAAGVLLLFIVNLIFVQRVLRASFPQWAWTKGFSLAFKLYYASIVLMLGGLIFCVVESFYTLDRNIRRIDRDVQLFGQTYFTVAGFLPTLLLLLKFMLRRQKSQVEKFGHGRFRTKIIVLLFSSLILTLGAAFRCGIAYVPRPANHPAWYHAKACFYVFNFTIEIIVVYLYIAIRVDRRFIVPNDSHGPGDYLRGLGSTKEQEHEHERRPSFADHIMNEEQVFDDEIPSAMQNGNRHVERKEEV